MCIVSCFGTAVQSSIIDALLQPSCYFLLRRSGDQPRRNIASKYFNCIVQAPDGCVLPRLQFKLSPHGPSITLLVTSANSVSSLLWGVLISFGKSSFLCGTGFLLFLLLIPPIVLILLPNFGQVLFACYPILVILLTPFSIMFILLGAVDLAVLQ